MRLTCRHDDTQSITDAQTDTVPDQMSKDETFNRLSFLFNVWVMMVNSTNTTEEELLT